MKLKFLAQVTFLLLLSVCTVQAATTLTVIGRHPFYKPPLKSMDELRGMMQTQQDAIMQGLQKAGSPQLYTPLMQQFSQADIQQVEYQPGETFRWMLFRPNGVGQVKAAQDITWGGTSALSSFEFSIDAGDKRYVFAVPLFCGNLALKEVVHVVVKEVPGPERIVEKVVEVPGPERIVEKTVPGPERIVEKVVEVPVEKIVKVPGPERIVKVPGPERIVEKVVEAPPQCCPPCIYPIRYVADAGYLRLSDPADFGFGRIGVEYAFNQRLSFLGMIGGATKADGSDGDDAWLVDLMVQYNLAFMKMGEAWNPIFLGFGLGGWMSDGDDDIDSEDSDIDIIAQVGAQLFGHPDHFNTSVFLEARSGIDEIDSLSEYGRFGAGLRFRF
ncbi:IMCp domain-containing protein [Candidatus Electrothrix sp.]|uniref:IMCp domain-containing protein n=2 Tax=Candidatus Electrothrix sp. TaxID=2170559 RepID=UPI00405777D2